MFLLMIFNQFELIFIFVKEMLQTSEKSQNVVKQLVFLLIWWASFNGIMIIFSQYEKKNPGSTSVFSPANVKLEW